MARRQPSPAELSFIAAVNDRLGTELSAQQLERWRADNYLRPLHRAWYGRKGSTSWWDTELLDEAVAFAAAKRGRTPLYESALRVFIAQGPIGEAAVKTAYTAALDATERYLRDGCDAEDPSEVARTVAPRMTRRLLRTKDGTRWKRRLATAGKDPRESLERICEAMIAVALGGPSPPQSAIEDFMVASGLKAAEHESVGGLGPWAPGLSLEPVPELLRQFSIPAQRATIEATPFEDLRSARDDTNEIFSLVSAFAPVIVDVAQTPDSLGFAEFTYLDIEKVLPMLVPAVLLFKERGLDVERIVKLARRFVPLLRALHVLLRAMPRYLRRFMAPGGIALLNRQALDKRLAFITQLKKSIADNPEAASVVRAHKE